MYISRVSVVNVAICYVVVHKQRLSHLIASRLILVRVILTMASPTHVGSLVHHGLPDDCPFRGSTWEGIERLWNFASQIRVHRLHPDGGALVLSHLDRGPQARKQDWNNVDHGRLANATDWIKESFETYANSKQKFNAPLPEELHDYDRLVTPVERFTYVPLGEEVEVWAVAHGGTLQGRAHRIGSVSYTHLTLPTKG